MKNEDFEITEEKIPDGIRFIIRGRINSIDADELLQKMELALNDGYKNIVLNMIQVEYLSSSGIRVILKSYKEAKGKGGKLGIEMPSANVKNVLGMTALEDMLIQ